MENILNITTLNNYIHNIFNAEEMLHNILICGEVSGFKISGRHAYFTLKDPGANIACSCFNYEKTYVPKEGEQILARGSVDYYAVGGKLSFVISGIKPYGVGALAIEFEKLKAKLTKDGFFDISHKKDIPLFCKRVCVITSKTGAVIRDIISTTRKYNSIIDLVIKDVRVQGIGAEKEIVNAIKEVDDLGFDTIIIARGGGSLEDLMPFNTESLVLAIYQASTPIISAVGHETDYTLCDFASDYRALTPTAAAEKIAFDEEKTKQNFTDIKAKLLRLLSQKVDTSFSKLNLDQHRLSSAFSACYSKNSNKLELFLTKISNLANICLVNNDARYSKLVGRLDANNPTKIFSKGYLYAEKEGQKIEQISQLEIGDRIDLKSQDGQAVAEIIEVKK